MYYIRHGHGHEKVKNSTESGFIFFPNTSITLIITNFISSRQIKMNGCELFKSIIILVDFFPWCYMLIEPMIILLSDILLKVVDLAQTVKFPSALASKSSFKVSDSRCLKSFTIGSLGPY